jgi:hypothetical protein
VLRWPLAVVIVLAASVIFLLATVNSDMGRDAVSNGNWHTNTNIGSKEAGVMLRATVAIGGLLASNRDDSIYYALTSIDGKHLSLNCQYKIEGNDYDANWWSITAYGWDFYLIPNSERRYSFNNENLVRDDDGNWQIYVSAHQTPGNWLPIGTSGSAGDDKAKQHDFDLLFRLYTPGDEYLTAPESAPLPKVSMEGCV